MRYITVLLLVSALTIPASPTMGANQCIAVAREEMKAAKQSAIETFKAAKAECKGASGGGNLPPDDCGVRESDIACCRRVCCPEGTTICAEQAARFCPRCSGAGYCAVASPCP